MAATYRSAAELDIAGQGDSIEAAIANLKEAVEGFFETVTCLLRTDSR